MRDQMKLESAPFTNSLENFRALPRRERKPHPLAFSILASIGVFGGISCLFAGMVFVVIHSFVSNDTIFDTAATVLLIAAIPMILAGSIFLDEIERKK